jgi:PIN domain nuclease of toxin-antitoxin system
MAVVLDSSAALAFLFGEPGSEMVVANGRGASLPSVNLAEVLTKLIDKGADRGAALEKLARLEMVVPNFTSADAEQAAALRDPTRARGLSLGDRGCIAVAKRLRLPVLTADRLWADLDLDLGIEIRMIR